MERYSFSKLSLFHTCPCAYKLRYIDKLPAEGNAFSSYGSFVHSVLERYAKGQLELWDLPEIYEWEFDSAIPYKFPRIWGKDLLPKYYQQGLDFFRSFKGYEGKKILGVEQNFDIPLDDFVFNGVIDLLYEDDGTIVVTDYKSKDKFSSRKERHEYARQLYLYAMYVKQKYGRYPERLRFVMFRSQTVEDILFNIEDFNEAVSWAKSTVESIRNCWDFPPKCEMFFAKYLCDQRSNCDLNQFIE